jgi:hypothetical protein
VEYFTVEGPRRRDVSDRVNDPDLGHEWVALLDDPDVVLIAFVVGGNLDVVGQAHTGQAHCEGSQTDCCHDNPLDPACHATFKRRPRVHACQAAQCAAAFPLDRLPIRVFPDRLHLPSAAIVRVARTGSSDIGPARC